MTSLVMSFSRKDSQNKHGFPERKLLSLEIKDFIVCAV